MKPALGLYTVYKNLTEDLERTLCQVSEMGYEGVEFYGPFQWEAARVRQALKQSGLAVCGWHVEWKLLQGDERKKSIEYQAALDSPTIVIPCLGGPWNVGHTPQEDCAEIWEAYAEKMNLISEEAGAAGMRLGYHTHAHEFETRFAAGSPWEILLRGLKKEVFLELDTGNCLEGGGDPAAALREAADRLYTVHCKPFGKARRENTPMGDIEDENNWPDIFKEAKAGGAVWMAAEDEASEPEPEMLAKRDGEFIKECLKNV